jgi:hypothetical protein
MCTYMWRLRVKNEREMEPDEGVENVRSVDWAVSSKTQKHSYTRHTEQPVWASLCRSLRSLGQCQTTKWTSKHDSSDANRAAMLGTCVCRRNVCTCCLWKLGCQNVAFSESRKHISVIITKFNAWTLSDDGQGLWMGNMQWSGGGGGFQFSKTTLLLLHFCQQKLCAHTWPWGHHHWC